MFISYRFKVDLNLQHPPDRPLRTGLIRHSFKAAVSTYWQRPHDPVYDSRRNTFPLFAGMMTAAGG